MLSRLSPPAPSPRAALGWGRALWLLSVAVFLALVVYVLTRPVRWLLAFVADDAFYYLQTARHIAATGRSTFDGLNPTNGYHPGWMLLMAFCARLCPHRVALLRACLGMEFAFHLAGAWLMARVLRRYAGSDWAWVGAAGWLLNPFALGLALNGVEAPLTIFCVLLVVRCWQTRIAPALGDGPLTRKGLVLLGLALAAAIYARTDQALLVPLVMLPLASALRRRAAHPDRATLRAIAWVLGTVTVCLLPWLAYSWATVGTLTQDSGAMKMLWHHQFWQGRGTAALLADVGLFMQQTWLAFPLTNLLGNAGIVPPVALGVCSLLLAAAVCAARRHPAARAFGALSACGALSLGLAGLVYGLTLTDFQRWHFAVPALLLYATLFGWLALAAQQRLPRRAQTVAGLLAFAAVCLPLARALRPLRACYAWQQDVYDSLPHFNSRVPAGARLGCLNAGIPAYFSDRTVINLDGLMNHTAVAYWQRGEFDAYLRDQHIAYIADEAQSLARAQRFSQSDLPLWTLSTCPLRGWDPPERLLWRVDLPRTASR